MRRDVRSGGLPVDKIRVGCAVVAVRDGRILLGRRGKEPMYGKWIIPGGGVGLFEHYTDTAVREFAEETGLKIRVHGVLHVAEIIVPEAEHRIVIYVSADIVGGSARASSDLLEVGAFTRREVVELAQRGELTPTVAGVLQLLGWISDDVLPPPLVNPLDGSSSKVGVRRKPASTRRSISNDKRQLEFLLN